MNLEPLWRPLLLYTGLLGLLTVGAIYLATHSGLYMLFVAGTGLLLVVLGGGTVGQMGASNVEHAGEKGGGNRVASNGGLWTPTSTDTSLRFTLLFYGLGVFLWSLVVLSTLGDTLV